MVTIKKYGNRRLYDSARSAYVNLDDIAAMVRAGTAVRVVDAATGDDLTHDVLLQVVLEVLRGQQLLPMGMLRRIIRATSDDPVQRVVRTQLSAGLALLSDQLDRMEALLGFGAPAPEAVPPSRAPEPEPEPAPPPDDGPDAELAALRERLAALEGRLRGPRPG